ncbi:MAG: arylamine N-acetyltransferase [Alphaproteobacteria bacterium]|nr:arylamine N-acetyltransferase [Alphaproteobacteria bacterium]
MCVDQPVNLEAYFDRVGYSGPREASLATLGALHALHPAAIPFENLDPLLGRRVRLDLESVQRKLLSSRRGGYCYEHNGLFAAVLTALGFRLTTLAARVVYGRLNPAGARRSHMLLKIDMPDGTYLADVGFGGQSPSAPLRLDTTIEQRTPHGLYRISRQGDWFELIAQMDGEWRALYRFTLEEQSPEDHEMANWYVSTHPDSEFRTLLFVARNPPGKRLTLLGNQFTIRDLSGASETRVLGSPEEIASVLEQDFLIHLPQPRNELLPALARAAMASRE